MRYIQINPKPDGVSQELVDYVESKIIPRYAEFDKAHREDHVRMVISRSLKLAERFPMASLDMIYTVAAFHDLGLKNGRENHHIYSGKILAADEFIRSRFKAEEIILMAEAVEDHRASKGTCPRNDYGLIVAEADRFIDAETIIRRTVQYGLANYPDLDREGHFNRTLSHLTEKYGPDGYLKIWIPGSENAVRLKHLHTIIGDRRLLTEFFDKIFDREASTH